MAWTGHQWRHAKQVAHRSPQRGFPSPISMFDTGQIRAQVPHPVHASPAVSASDSGPPVSTRAKNRKRMGAIFSISGRKKDPITKPDSIGPVRRAATVAQISPIRSLDRSMRVAHLCSETPRAADAVVGHRQREACRKPTTPSLHGLAQPQERLPRRDAVGTHTEEVRGLDPLKTPHKLHEKPRRSEIVGREDETDDGCTQFEPRLPERANHGNQLSVKCSGNAACDR